jgi:hypothetical protein
MRIFQLLFYSIFSEKAPQAKWCGNNNPHYVISRSNRIFVYVFAKSNLSNSSKNFILKLEESSESSNLDAVFEGNRAYFEKEGVAVSAGMALGSVLCKVPCLE